MYVKPTLWILLFISVREGERFNLLHFTSNLYGSIPSVDTCVCVYPPSACVCVQRCLFVSNTFTVCAPVSLQEDEYNYEDDAYDPQPLECSTTETIKGGHVTYSKVKIIHRQSIDRKHNRNLFLDCWSDKTNSFLLFKRAHNNVMVWKIVRLM